MPFEELLKVEKPKFLKIKELEQLLKGLIDDVDYLYDRYADKKISWQEYQELVQKLHQNIIDNLISQKEKLSHIFQTERGSYYFVLNSGHSWRIKSGEKGLVSQPIIDNVFFVDNKEADDIIREIEKYGTNCLIGRDIECASFKKGVSPLEIGIHNANKPVLEKVGRWLKILGSRPRDKEVLEKNITCGVHIGHEINEIIK